MSHLRLTGISLSRTASVVAFSEIARLGWTGSAASRSMPGTTPEVERVTRRGETAIPSSSVISRNARMTFS